MVITLTHQTTLARYGSYSVPPYIFHCGGRYSQRGEVRSEVATFIILVVKPGRKSWWLFIVERYGVVGALKVENAEGGSAYICHDVWHLLYSRKTGQMSSTVSDC
jgi:hypothetical protein